MPQQGSDLGAPRPRTSLAMGPWDQILADGKLKKVETAASRLTHKIPPPYCMDSEEEAY